MTVLIKRVSKQKHSIEEIISNKWLVRFNREPFDNSYNYGFVLDCSDDFTLLNNYNEDAGVTGFCVFPNSTVKKYKIYDDANSFKVLSLELKDTTPKEKPNVSIQTIEKLLESVNKSFPLIVVHCERLNRDVVWIGKVMEIKKKSFTMLEITPNAEWLENPNRFKFKDVTKIEFGNGYENDLHSVAEYRKQKSREV